MPHAIPSALESQFRPVAPIAEGGFGGVWKAVQVALDRSYVHPVRGCR